ncbi:MAG: GPW/gp25 family protein [Synergistaceae bacterium]|nr:GPW/gp25 family protein [Synergistaceae bacterium]
MEFEVLGKPGPINFGATGVEEVLQNVQTFLCTHRGSVVLDREFGIDGSVVDRPIPKARAIITSDILRNLSRYEPRVKVLSVTFDGDGIDGVLAPKVKVQVNLGG